MTKPYDVCVAGAGMTGRLMALALSRSGFDVLLVDRGPDRPSRDDGRTTALAYASVRLMKRLGIWDALAPKAEPITDILVSNGAPRDRFRPGGLTGGSLHFPAQLLGGATSGPQSNLESEARPEEALGYIAENKDLLGVMDAALGAGGEGGSDRPIDKRFETEIVDVHGEPSQGRTELVFRDGARAESALLVACDGRASPLRGMMGLQALRWDYGQAAIITNVRHERPHEGVAHELFYPGGPFAVLPMQEQRSSIVWTDSTSRAGAFMALDNAGFLADLQDRVGDHLGALALDGPRQTFPLSFLYAPQLTAERFVLAGDAAHGIHPIAGQGFNLGVKDVAALAAVLAEARSAGLDIGHGAVLGGYARWRRFDNAALAFGTDALNRLFSNSLGPLAHARGLGLAAVQRIDPLRRLFMRVSGADLGDLPPLMRPL